MNQTATQTKKFVRLKTVSIKGFKSIRELSEFSPGNLSVLIGANGAGKSNFISFFRMMNWILQNPGQLQIFLAKYGRASSFLHDGPQVTHSIDAHLVLETNDGENEYKFQLTFAAGDTLIFTDERYRFSAKNHSNNKNEWFNLNSMGRSEAGIIDQVGKIGKTAKTIFGLIKSCVVYQFHDTSLSSKMRNYWSVDDGNRLREDGGNIAPFLMKLKDVNGGYYSRAIEYLRMSIPFFADFILEPYGNKVILQWKEIGSDFVFSAHSASDGMLRYIALVALLSQPPNDLPPVIILDEPELGLHPYAISVVSGLIKSASRHSQILVSTQSTALIDNFSLNDIVVLERRNRETVFKKVNAEEYKEWAENYTTSELWEKNVLGGRPSK